MMALGISLLSTLCACGNVESEKNMVEAILNWQFPISGIS
jgi:hypothetical protein